MTTTEPKSLGQVAYEAYASARQWTTFDGGAMPPWDEQNSAIAAAWQQAAVAAAEYADRYGAF